MRAVRRSVGAEAVVYAASKESAYQEGCGEEESRGE